MPRIKGTVPFKQTRNSAVDRRSTAWRVGKEGLTLSFGLAVLATACSSKPAAGPASPGWYSETRELYFGIPVTVKFTPAADELAERVWRKLGRVDEVFNIYREDSEVSRVNAASTRGGFTVSADLARALELSRRLHDETESAFDVTVGPLVELWRGVATAGRLPTSEEVASARALAGMRYSLSGTRWDTVALRGLRPVRRKTETHRLVRHTPGTTFDFGGIVKGMAVDDVVTMLKEAGCTAALVQVGGETGAYGLSPKGRRHIIGVQNPLNPFDLSDIWTAVQDPGTGISAATSGNYRQPIVIGGEVFYHIIDPRTGYPVDTHTLSVTVVFPETGKNALADGLSTAGAVLGPEKAIPIVERLGGEALFLLKEGDSVREAKSAGWDTLEMKGTAPLRDESRQSWHGRGLCAEAARSRQYQCVSPEHLNT